MGVGDVERVKRAWNWLFGWSQRRTEAAEQLEQSQEDYIESGLAIGPVRVAALREYDSGTMWGIYVNIGCRWSLEETKFSLSSAINKARDIAKDLARIEAKQ